MPRVDAAVDANPDEASRAVDVARTIGGNPAAVAETLPETERNTKQELSHQIVAADPWLQKFLNEHPIAAPLISDDLSKVSKAGDSYHKVATAASDRPWWETEPLTIGQTKFGHEAAAGMSRAIAVNSAKPLATFGRWLGSENLAGIVHRVEESFDKDIPMTDEEKEAMPYLVSSGLGQILSLIPYAMAGGVPGAAIGMGLQSAYDQAEKAIKAGADWQTPSVGGFVIGATLGMIPLGKLEKIITGGPAKGAESYILQRLKEAFSTGAVLTGASEAAEYATSILDRATFDPYAQYSPDAKRMIANMIGGAILGPTFGAIKAFIDGGQHIPPGVHPVTDAIAIEKTKVDNEALDDAFKDANAAALKGRQPEYLARYYKLRPDASMGLDGDAVLKLYGNKPPGPGDGILGDVVPNIEAQLQAARNDGSDIQIPLADYLAKVDPKIDTELHDFRRVGSGLTLDEAKNMFAAPSTEGDTGAEIPPILKAEEPRLGGLARSGDPGVDGVRAQMGVDKILPLPVEQVYDYTPGPGIIPKGVTLDGPAVERYGANGAYKVLKEIPARDMLDAVDISHLHGIPKSLYMFFGDRLKKAVGDTPVQIVTDAEMKRIYTEVFGEKPGSPAFYWGGSSWRGLGPRIVITDSMANGMRGQDYVVHAIIHEMAHAASVREMRADPKLSADLLALKNETRDWLQKNDPDAFDNPGIRYAFKDADGFEYVAQAYSEPDFQNQLSRIPVSKELAERLGHPAAHNIWDLARNLIKRALEKVFGKLPPTILDEMFTMGERFEAAVDARIPELRPLEKEDKGITDGLPTPEERQLYQDQKALGYTKDHWNRIKDKLADQRAADNELQRKRALKDATERQTENWKQNAAEMRPDAQTVVYGRPGIRADRFLRLGILDGSKVTRQRLDGSAIDPNVRDQLSPEWYNKKSGIKPDDIAGVLGYKSGDAMLSDLVLMKTEMDKAGLTHSAFIESRIAAQVDTMMRKKYGSLDTQILEDAKDHVISDGTFDLMHEDTLRLATKLGFEAPFTKDQVKSMAREEFQGQRSGDIKSSRQADNTGRVGRKIEDAENKGDMKEVMRLADQRERSFYKTILAREYEKLEGKYDKVARNHKKIELTAFKEPEAAAYHDFIQLLLGDVGEKINRKYSDVKHEFEEKGYKTFKDFVDAQWDTYDELVPAPAWILDGKHQMPKENMTVGESESFMGLVMALDKLGRERFKVNTAYGVKELEPAWNAARDTLAQQYDIRGRTAAGEDVKFGELGKTGRWYLVGSRVMERILSRWDFDNPRGAWNQFVVRPVKDGEAHWEQIKKDYGKKFRDLGAPEDLDKAVELPFVSPSTGRAFTRSTRKELLTIMLNMGSVENWTKFHNGWKTDPTTLEQWVMHTATEADWKWVKGVWDIFGQMKKELDGAYRRTTGTPPGTKEFRTIDTPWGPVQGGYYPLLHDRIEMGKGSKIASYTVEDGPGFWQQNIPNPHAKEVTGAEYPVSMNLDFLPQKFDQIAFDIAMREPMHEVKKFLGNEPLRQDIKNRAGVEYDAAINSWLHDVSHSAEYNTAAAIQGNKISQFFRQNTIGYLVGANISTVLKHGPTALFLSLRFDPQYLMKGYASLFKANPINGDTWWKWMNENAQEIQRRDRYWQETYGGVYREFTGDTSIRDTIIRWGAKPVAFSDKISAKPLWLGAYMHAIDNGADFGEAKFEADRAVRFAHGSTAISNLPEFVRGHGLQSWFTSLYGFFGTVLQNRIEIGFKLNDMYRLGRQGELGKMAKIAPLLAADVFAYVIAPTFIEEYVTGLFTEDRRGLMQHTFWGTAAGVSNSFLGFRDLTHMLEYGMTDSGGLLSSAAKPFTHAFKDLSNRENWSKERAGDLIEDLLGLAGPFTGLPKEVGNLERYGWNTMIANRETPYTGLFENWNKFGDLGRGIFKGTQKRVIRK